MDHWQFEVTIKPYTYDFRRKIRPASFCFVGCATETQTISFNLTSEQIDELRHKIERINDTPERVVSIFFERFFYTGNLICNNIKVRGWNLMRPEPENNAPAQTIGWDGDV